MYSLPWFVSFSFCFELDIKHQISKADFFYGSSAELCTDIMNWFYVYRSIDHIVMRKKKLGWSAILVSNKLQVCPFFCWFQTKYNFLFKPFENTLNAAWFEILCFVSCNLSGLWNTLVAVCQVMFCTYQKRKCC